MGKQMIPDTLMLGDRAALSINAILGTLDSLGDNTPFFSSDLTENPACLRHSPWDFGQAVGRHLDGIMLARHMSGSTYGAEQEAVLREMIFKYHKDDGLSYRDKSGTNQGYANFHDQPHVLQAYTTWFMTTGDERPVEYGKRLCDGLKAVMSKELDFWFMPMVEYSENGWPVQDYLYMHTASDPAHINGRMLGVLVKFHEVTGCKSALEVAENSAYQVVHQSAAFNPDGSFNDKLEFRNGHFHSRMITVAAIIRYAAYVHDAAMLNWGKKVYDWALTQCTAFGYTPGNLHRNPNLRSYSETCTLTDFIDAGIVLALNGYPEYWDTVQRFVRNHLVEAQLLDGSWIKSLDDRSKDIPGEVSYYKIGERMVGAFAGYAAPNDFVNERFHQHPGWRVRGRDIQACCLPTGTRGLFLAWNNIVTRKFDRVMVNLHMNKSCDLLDVSSYLPYEGKLELDIHQEISELLVRIPDWVIHDDTCITRIRDGETLSIAPDAWLAKHVKVGNARKGDKFIVGFPLRQIKTQELAIDQYFEATWRGDDVVEINPPGKYYPFYSGRKSMITDQTPMREGPCYRPRKEIYW